jgi:hypothetical protein
VACSAQEVLQLGFARQVLLVLLAVPALARAGGEPPRIDGLEGPTRVLRYELFETRADVTPVPTNPFDPAQIDVRAVFVAPNGSEREAIGFWYQGYERALDGDVEVRTPLGAPHFRVRFTPDRTGVWRWYWVVKTPAGEVRSEKRRLRVGKSKRPGFLRRSRRDERQLAFDDGSSYFAVGENLSWYDARGSYAYDAWLGALAEQGASWARLWMPSWAMGLEWSDTGLGDYTARLDRAWQLDTVLAEAERRGIYVQLVLQNHGAFSTTANSEWEANPYNAANGGPLASAAEFWTDPEARALFQRRLRYVVARWGYSTAILAWELWNEADLADGYAEGGPVEWHREMADFLRAHDPHDHLVTTSFAVFVFDDAVWNGSGLDLSQLHFYSTIESSGGPVVLSPNLAQDVAQFSAIRRGATSQPVLFAELGVDARGPAETKASDPGGIGVHDGLFAGVVSGGYGTAMTWWWDNLVDLEPELYYPMIGAAARFVAGVRFDRERFAPFEGVAEGSARPLVARGLQGRRTLLLWLKDDAFQWYAPEPAEIAGATLRLDALPRGRWCGAWYDSWAGAEGEAVRVRGGRPATLAVPTFSRDLGLRLRRCKSAGN